MKKVFLYVLFLVGYFNVEAQFLSKKYNVKQFQQVCYASEKVEKSFIPPPATFTKNLKSAIEPKSDIIVNYSLFPPEAELAFEYAVSVWEGLIDSPIPIYVQANWRALEQTVLGNCGSEEFIKNFTNAPLPDIYYPIAIAEKLSETEIYDENLPDIEANFNRNSNWYFGLDGKTPDSLYDFVTVVMHEIGHGLGMTGFFNASGNIGYNKYNDFGDATSFDHLIVKSNGDELLDTLLFPNQSTELKNALTSNGLFANSPAGKILGGGARPRLYAPSAFDNGSSIYHLNESTYNGTINSLMTYALGKAEAVHDPGPIMEGIMADIGWKHLYIDIEPLKDLETVEPITLKVNLKSDYDLDTSSIKLYISVDSFQSDINFVLMEKTEVENQFMAQITPDANQENLYYYIEAGDVMKRTFTEPVDAPKSFFSIHFGPDTVKPVITHQEIPYYLLTENQLKISTRAEDNLGVDTVYVTYSINDIEQTPFGLTHDSAAFYSAFFPLNNELLTDGDEIKYNIIAVDASVAKNIESIPSTDKFSFKIDQLFDPVINYSTDFNGRTEDFVLSDFSVFKESGFENAALHSPHPYPATEINNEDLNLTSILKHPIIIANSGYMSFDEVVLVEPGTSGTSYGDFEFWDYVVVEASKDFGRTWKPLKDGYDSRANTDWNKAYTSLIIDHNSKAAGTSNLYEPRNINLLESENFVSGDTVLIRFRLYSDPFSYGWGWAIDNLQIQQVVSSELTHSIPPEIAIYPNPVNNKLKVEIHSTSEIRDIVIDVFNGYGQKITSVNRTSGYSEILEEIDFSKFGDGIYFISVKENGKQILSKKVLKQN